MLSLDPVARLVTVCTTDPVGSGCTGALVKAFAATVVSRTWIGELGCQQTETGEVETRSSPRGTLR